MKISRLKGIVVVIGAILCSTLGIFAADTLRGIDGNLAQLIGSRSSETCGEGSVPFRIDDFLVCVDQYESSPASACPHASLASTLQSEQNLNTDDCRAVSAADGEPWTYISLPQAQRACAAAGKRLPTSNEWHQIALGTNVDTCVIDAMHPEKSGDTECIAASGAYNAIGNVWEWVDAQVVNGVYEGRTLPETGHVTSVDADGVAVTTGGDPDPLYGDDYFWSKQEGVFGMIRGGFYGSGADAGLYTLNASVPTAFTAQGVGFRCVKDVL